jgi:hypothetical protein
MAAAIVVAAAALFLWRPWSQPPPEVKPPGPAVVPVAPAQITLIARLPRESQDRVRLLVLTTTHPDLGTRVDTIKAADGGARQQIELPAATNIRFALRGLDREGIATIEGEISRAVASAETVTVEIPLHALPALVEERPVVDHPGTTTRTGTDTAKPTPPEKVSPTRRTVTEPNLTIDVQPFTIRQMVDQLWIDGDKVAGRLPLKKQVNPGLRFIRWQIGDGRFTDTVTVGATTPSECALFIEHGRGRLNIAAPFADGGFGEIWLDGVDMGQGTPSELRGIPAGPHEVLIVREGYRMRGGPQIVQVKANDRTRVAIEMIPQ